MTYLHSQLNNQETTYQHLRTGHRGLGISTISYVEIMGTLLFIPLLMIDSLLRWNCGRTTLPAWTTIAIRRNLQDFESSPAQNHQIAAKFSAGNHRFPRSRLHLSTLNFGLRTKHHLRRTSDVRLQLEIKNQREKKT